MSLQHRSCWSICDHSSEPPFTWDLCAEREQTQNWDIHILHSVFYLLWDSVSWSVSLWSHEAVFCDSWCDVFMYWKRGSNRLLCAWRETVTEARWCIPASLARCGSATFPMWREKYACVWLYIKGGRECVCMMWKISVCMVMHKRRDSVCVCVHERGREEGYRCWYEGSRMSAP